MSDRKAAARAAARKKEMIREQKRKFAEAAFIRNNPPNPPDFGLIGNFQSHAGLDERDVAALHETLEGSGAKHKYQELPEIPDFGDEDPRTPSFLEEFLGGEIGTAGSLRIEEPQDSSSVAASTLEESGLQSPPDLSEKDLAEMQTMHELDKSGEGFSLPSPPVQTQPQDVYTIIRTLIPDITKEPLYYLYKPFNDTNSGKYNLRQLLQNLSKDGPRLEEAKKLFMKLVLTGKKLNTLKYKGLQSKKIEEEVQATAKELHDLVFFIK